MVTVPATSPPVGSVILIISLVLAYNTYYTPSRRRKPESESGGVAQVLAPARGPYKRRKPDMVSASEEEKTRDSELRPKKPRKPTIESVINRD